MSYEVTPMSSAERAQDRVTSLLPSARPRRLTGRDGALWSSGVGAGVVTGTAALGSERFPAASRARTVKL